MAGCDRPRPPPQAAQKGAQEATASVGDTDVESDSYRTMCRKLPQRWRRCQLRFKSSLLKSIHTEEEEIWKGKQNNLITSQLTECMLKEERRDEAYLVNSKGIVN
ncbi:Ripor Family Member 3 [Manis pentadactyla]|nr:Ripor Family Member 3 [Manis pentadactyla]